MANVEHLKILKQGVEVWNSLRMENPGMRPDLQRPHRLSWPTPEAEKTAGEYRVEREP